MILQQRIAQELWTHMPCLCYLYNTQHSEKSQTNVHVPGHEKRAGRQNDMSKIHRKQSLKCHETDEILSIIHKNM